MTRARSVAAAAAFVLASAANAELLGGALGPIDFGSAPDAVMAAATDRCDHARMFTEDAPAIPLAMETESHTVCLGYETAGGESIDEVAFTFADGELAMVQARGGALAALLPIAGEKTVSLAGLDYYAGASLIVDPADDHAWMLTEEGMHTSMFAWKNPALPSIDAPAEPYSQSVEIPDALSFGGAYENEAPRIKNASALFQERAITPPSLPTQPDLQIQIDAIGIVFAGFPRKVEAVFGDGVLEMAWILTGAAEEGRVRELLIAEYGEPELVTPTFEIFAGYKVALRKDVTEVLIVNDHLKAVFRAMFEGQGGGGG